MAQPLLCGTLLYVMLVSCGQKPAKISLAERKAMDSIVSSSHDIDTLSMIQKRMEREGNMLGSIVAYRAMGKELRNDSRFDEALKRTQRGTEAGGDLRRYIRDSAGSEQYRHRLSENGNARHGSRLPLPRFRYL